MFPKIKKLRNFKADGGGGKREKSRVWGVIGRKSKEEGESHHNMWKREGHGGTYRVITHQN